MQQQHKQRGASVDAHLNDYHHRNESAQQKRQMYEDRIQIFNNEAHRPTIVSHPSVSSQRLSFQSSKSIDAADSPHSHPTPLSTKTYESMSNLTQKNIAASMPSGLKEKTLSRPRIPMIREKSAPNTPHLNPSLSRRTTTAGQHRVEVDKTKAKSLEDKYRKTVKKRGRRPAKVCVSIRFSSLQSLRKRPVTMWIRTDPNYRQYRRSVPSVCSPRNPNDHDQPERQGSVVCWRFVSSARLSSLRFLVLIKISIDTKKFNWTMKNFVKWPCVLMIPWPSLRRAQAELNRRCRSLPRHRRPRWQRIKRTHAPMALSPIPSWVINLNRTRNVDHRCHPKHLSFLDCPRRQIVHLISVMVNQSSSTMIDDLCCSPRQTIRFPTERRDRCPTASKESNITTADQQGKWNTIECTCIRFRSIAIGSLSSTWSIPFDASWYEVNTSVSHSWSERNVVCVC